MSNKPPLIASSVTRVGALNTCQSTSKSLLRRSIKAGLDDPALLAGEPDLDSVRRLPAYADVRAKLKFA